MCGQLGFKPKYFLLLVISTFARQNKLSLLYYFNIQTAYFGRQPYDPYNLDIYRVFLKYSTCMQDIRTFLKIPYNLDINSVSKECCMQDIKKIHFKKTP